jgi:hypothetical protein
VGRKSDQHVSVEQGISRRNFGALTGFIMSNVQLLQTPSSKGAWCARDCDNITILAAAWDKDTWHYRAVYMLTSHAVLSRSTNNGNGQQNLRGKPEVSKDSCLTVHVVAYSIQINSCSWLCRMISQDKQVAGDMVAWLSGAMTQAGSEGH